MNRKLIILPIILSFLSLLYSEEIGCLSYDGDIGELKDSLIEIPKEIFALYKGIVVKEINIDTMPDNILLVDFTMNSITVSGIDPSNNVFLFADNFPFTGIKTNFTYNKVFTIARDSITPNGDTIVIVRDSTDSGSFNIEIDPGVTDPPVHYPHDFELIFWERELSFNYNGSPLELINESMDTINLSFTYDPGDKDYHYTNVIIEVVNTEGVLQDKETYKLSKSGYTFSVSFPRVVIKDNIAPNIGDGILQHYKSDSIAATFRNKEVPQLPLDTIRIAVPYKSSTAINLNPFYNQRILSLNIINSSILLNLPNSGNTKLQIYTMKGRLLSTLVDSYKQAGRYKFNFDGKRFGAGVYFIKLKANGSEVSKKVTVIR